MARHAVVMQGSPKSAYTVQARFAVPNLSSPGISSNPEGARRDDSTQKARCSSVTPAQRADAVARQSGVFQSEVGTGSSKACSLAAMTMAPEAGSRSRVVTDPRLAVARSASARPLSREVTNANATILSTQHHDSRCPTTPPTSTSRVAELQASSRAMYSASTWASLATRAQEVTNSNQCNGQTSQFQSSQKVQERFAALESSTLGSMWIAQLTLRKEQECSFTPESPLIKPSRAMTPLSIDRTSWTWQAQEGPSKVDSPLLLGAAPEARQQPSTPRHTSVRAPSADVAPGQSHRDNTPLARAAAHLPALRWPSPLPTHRDATPGLSTSAVPCSLSQPPAYQDDVCDSRRGSVAGATPCFCNLETVVAAGDVLFFKGNRNGLSSAGTAGGLLGHVMLVLAPPTRICAHSEEAEWLEDVWPKDGASEIWWMRTAESARKKAPLYEAKVLLHVGTDTGRLTFIGEVLGESVLTSGEEVEVWQSPEDLRMRLDAKLVDEVLAEMRDQATSWSWATAARAIFASAAGGRKGSGIGYLQAVGGATISGGLEGATGTASGESKAQFLREIKNTWASDPICTSVVISFWQRVICKLAGGVGSAGGEESAIAPSALAHDPADLILHWMPLWADRSLPHKLRETMQTCGWRNGTYNSCDRASL